MVEQYCGCLFSTSLPLFLYLLPSIKKKENGHQEWHSPSDNLGDKTNKQGVGQ